MRLGMVAAAGACALMLPASASALTCSDSNYAVGTTPEDVAVELTGRGCSVLAGNVCL